MNEIFIVLIKAHWWNIVDDCGAPGRYWSSSLNSAAQGRYLSFYSGGVNPQSNGSRFYGFAVRPVQVP